MEPTHRDLLDRIGLVEAKQAEMQVAIQRVGEEAHAAHKAAADNRKHFDDKLDAVRLAEIRTHTELVEHRAEVNGKLTGLSWGLTITGFVITTGLIILGYLLER